MILVKRKYLFILVCLFSLIVIFGEVKFFYAINSMNLAGNLDVKYEVESFIFAFIIIVLIVYMFLIHAIRRSTNLLKRMDKLIELSSYGQYDINSHLDKLGPFGKKVKYILFHLSRLNDLKTIKISATSDIIRILMKQSEKEVFIFDRAGNIVKLEKKMASPIKTGQKLDKPQTFHDIFISMNCAQIYSYLDKNRSTLNYENVEVTLGSEKINKNVEFHPVTNIKGVVSNIVAII